MPVELQNAELILSEEKFFCQKPFPQVMKPDQLYLNEHGLIVPVDTKRRWEPALTWKDVIQVSAYGVGIRHTWHEKLVGKEVASYGYIRFAVPDRREGAETIIYKRFKMLSEAKVIELWLLKHLPRERVDGLF